MRYMALLSAAFLSAVLVGNVLGDEIKGPVQPLPVFGNLIEFDPKGLIKIYWSTIPGGKGVAGFGTEEMLLKESGVAVFDVDGMRLHKDEVVRRFKKNMPVMISQDGKPLDPYYRPFVDSNLLMLAFPRDSEPEPMMRLIEKNDTPPPTKTKTTFRRLEEK